MKRGMEFFADKMQESLSRSVTYHGIRNGSVVSLSVAVGLGMSQLTDINMLGMNPSINDASLSDPSEVDRDYIVRASDLIDAGLWPPDSGDMVDDDNDETDVTKRYQVKSVSGQASWRWLRGSYNVLARVHTKFFQVVATYWNDTFTGSGALTSHTPNTGTGGYSGGEGAVMISGNKIVAGDGLDYHYFAPGELNTVTTADIRFNVTANDLKGKFAELGVIVRAAPAEDMTPRREGVYCTVKIGYVGSSQTTRQLRMVRRRNEANTTVAVLDLPDVLGLATTYKLVVTNTNEKIVLELRDKSGDVTIASVGNESTLLNDLTLQGVFFNHTLSDPSGPWIDNLNVEAA